MIPTAPLTGPMEVITSRLYDLSDLTSLSYYYCPIEPPPVSTAPFPPRPGRTWQMSVAVEIREFEGGLHMPRRGESRLVGMIPPQKWLDPTGAEILAVLIFLCPRQGP